MVHYRWFGALAGALILGVLVAAASTIVLGQTRADALAKAGDAHSGLVALERSGIGVGPLSPFELITSSQRTAPLVHGLRSVEGVQAVVAPTDPAWHRGGTALVDVL